MKIDFGKILENKVAKIGLLVSLITGLQFFVPWAQDLIVGDKIENNNAEVYEYIDSQNELQDSISFDWELYFIEEFIRVDSRYIRDSLKNAEKNRYFAVGLRADKETGTLHYRDRWGVMTPVRGDDSVQRYMFRKQSDGTWHWCYYEE